MIELNENMSESELVQRLVINNLAHTEMKDANIPDDPEEAYVDGYNKGWWTAFNTAIKEWKDKAMKYDELVKNQ